MSALLGIGLLALQVLVVVYVVRAIIYLRRQADPATDEHWYVRPFVSIDDALGQLLLAVGITLGVVGLIVISRRLGLPVRADAYLFVGVIVSFVLSWRLRAPALLVLGAFGAWGWWGSASWQWSKLAQAGGVAVPIGLALVSLALMFSGRLLEGSGRGRRFGWFSWLFGMLGVLIFLFWASSQEGVAQLGELSQGSPFVASVALALATGAVLAGTALLLGLTAATRRESLAETVGLGVLWAVLLGLAIRPPVNTSNSPVDIFAGGTVTLTSEGMFWAVVFNLLLLGGLLGLVFLGYLRRENWLVNLGAVFLFVFVIFKYFDWLFTFLDRSVAFIVSGLLLIGVGAAMERGRRYVIKAIGAEDERAE